MNPLCPTPTPTIPSAVTVTEFSTGPVLEPVLVLTAALVVATVAGFAVYFLLERITRESE